MILTQHDLDEFEREWELLQEGEDDEDGVSRFHEWLVNNPQVLMASTFQEFVGAHELPLYKTLQPLLIQGRRPAFRTYDGRWLLLSAGQEEIWEGFSIDGLERALTEDPEFGIRFDHLFDEAALPLPEPARIIAEASKVLSAPPMDPVLFVSPKLWTPFSQEFEKNLLQSSTVGLIRSIQAETAELRSLHWREFEDIVAEVLRAQGMEIHVVRERPQGGRDIIARTALVPGREILTIAVEVKHKEVVDRPDVQRALYQNRAFPTLMFMTSGRFSAGVIREAQYPENRMRLLLRDGVAVRELIRCYAINA